MERVKRRKQKRAIKQKETLQPYIIAIGSQLTAIETFYIIIDDIMYKMENVLKKMLISCTRSSKFLMSNPSAYEQVWLFIQKYIYGRTTEWDKYDKFVMNLIDFLDNFLDFKDKI